jgi:upstream activation factor subunit UAF30
MASIGKGTIFEKKKGQLKAASHSAFMSPLTPDAALAAVVGKDPIPRTEVTKRVWEYIRKHNLQDPKDKRTIKADANLRQVFEGKDSVSMFELTKMVNNHLHKDAYRTSSRLDGDPITDYERREYASGSSVDGDHSTDYTDPKKPGKNK